MSQSDIIDGMKRNFEDNLEIPEDYEYLSTEQIKNEIGLELDGYGFSNSPYLIYIDCRALPTSFGIHVIKQGKGEVESEETHESREASEIVNDLMSDYN